MHKPILRHVFSPYGLAIISYLFFLFGWSFPPRLYSGYMSEPDLMFLDSATVAFFSLCILSFLSGVAYIDFVLPRKDFVLRKIETNISSFKFLSIPVVIALAFCIASCILLLKKYPSLILAVISQMGSAIKESDIGLHSPLGLSNTWLMGILWWAIWRCNKVAEKKWSNYVLKFLFLAALAACTFSATLKVSRGELMPLLIGTSVICVLAKEAKGTLTNRYIATYGIVLFCGLTMIFVLFSFVRGNTDAFWGDLISYTMASYNRLSALIHHKFSFPYAGRGFYLCSFLQSNNMLNSVIPLRKIFGWPDFMTFWQSEFNAVSSSGLNGNLIWSGTFGYIFSEVGWFSPLFVFMYGLLYGYVWRLLKRGNTFGIVLYPWFAFCILFWFGTNYLFDNKCLVLFLDALLLLLYERTVRRLHVFDKTPTPISSSVQY
jgi:hypothetical protein